MTRDDVLRMAREAGIVEDSLGYAGGDVVELERFAALVASAEREECAKVCDWLNGEKHLTPAGCAAAIRITIRAIGNPTQTDSAPTAS